MKVTDYTAILCLSLTGICAQAQDTEENLLAEVLAEQEPPPALLPFYRPDRLFPRVGGNPAGAEENGNLIMPAPTNHVPFVPDSPVPLFPGDKPVAVPDKSLTKLLLAPEKDPAGLDLTYLPMFLAQNQTSISGADIPLVEDHLFKAGEHQLRLFYTGMSDAKAIYPGEDRDDDAAGIGYFYYPARFITLGAEIVGPTAELHDVAISGLAGFRLPWDEGATALDLYAGPTVLAGGGEDTDFAITVGCNISIRLLEQFDLILGFRSVESSGSSDYLAWHTGIAFKF